MQTSSEIFTRSYKYKDQQGVSYKIKRRMKKYYVVILLMLGVIFWQYCFIKYDKRKLTCEKEVMTQFPNDETIYIITPTYERSQQIAELTRLAQTLMLVSNIYWLVIEDAETPNPLVASLLKRKGLKHEHLVAQMPEKYRNKSEKPKGVANRNKGLEWIRANAIGGVFYFADDDNTYDVELFEEMRHTKRVSMWPVGLVAQLSVSTPVLNNGNFVRFYDGWIGGRKFPCDMASFAVSVKFLLSRPKAAMPYIPGHEEDGFLSSLAPFEPDQLEFRASNCTRILVWHTQSKAFKSTQDIDINKYNNTNMLALKNIVVEKRK